MDNEMNPKTLFRLPDIVIMKIFSYLPFDEVSRLRIVSRAFDDVGREVLNKGFLSVEKYHVQCLKAVKMQLPRRESERRMHPLARHSDVLTAIETRLSMLSMTYTKYIEYGVCCFIPGKVIDETYRILRSIKSSNSPPRTHEVLQELRDISSMAMEHFDEKISPGLKQEISSNTGTLIAPLLAMTGNTGTRNCTPHEMQTLLDMQAGIRRTKVSTALMRKELKSLRSKVRRQGRQLVEQGARLREHSSKMAEQDAQLAEMKRLLDEYGQKMSEMTTELSKVRGADGASSTSPLSSDLSLQEGLTSKRKLPAEDERIDTKRLKV